jgi:hypothetical protein
VLDDFRFTKRNQGRDDLKLKEFKAKLKDCGLYFYED